MVPMIDSAVPGITSMVLTVGPDAIAFLLALVGGVGWIVSCTAGELRRDRHVEMRLARSGEDERLAA